jgi:hydrogenase maturation protease
MSSASQHAKIALVGVGNILFMDEGAGVYASCLLAANYSFVPEIEIVDGGTLGFKLMEYLQEYEKVILFDTLSIEDAPGTVYTLPAEALIGLGEYRKSVHEVEVVGMLEICSLLEKTAQVSIVGIIPEDITRVEVNLSCAVKKQLPLMLEQSILLLRASGVEVIAKASPKSIEEIIGFYDGSKAYEAFCCG